MREEHNSTLERQSAKRVRASKRALEIAIDVMRAKGLPIQKIIVSGGRYEIHCEIDEDIECVDPDDGLKSL